MLCAAPPATARRGAPRRCAARRRRCCAVETTTSSSVRRFAAPLSSQFLYLFDASQWKSAGLKLLRRLLYAAVALSIGLALVMAADDYPFVPLFLCALGIIGLVVYLRKKHGRKQRPPLALQTPARRTSA